MAVFKTLSLNQPTLQVRESNIGDKKLFSELRTLVRDISKQFTIISSTLEIEDWHEVGATDEPAFEGNWANYTATDLWNTAAFYKDPFGVVRLKGLVENTVDTGAGTAIFILPVGYRPTKKTMFITVATSESSARVTVFPTGEVNLDSGDGSAYLSLDVINFRI